VAPANHGRRLGLVRRCRPVYVCVYVESVAQGNLGVAVKEAVDEHPLSPLLLGMLLGQQPHALV
jgi:hypothetical protein